MAGDWFPWTVGLTKRREVLAIAEATGHHRWYVAGALAALWEWVTEESEDGCLQNVSILSLVEATGGDTKLWEAVAAVGWLQIDEHGISIPKWDRWLAMSAKARLRKTLQKRKERRNKRCGRVAKVSPKCRQSVAKNCDMSPPTEDRGQMKKVDPKHLVPDDALLPPDESLRCVGGGDISGSSARERAAAADAAAGVSLPRPRSTMDRLMTEFHFGFARAEALSEARTDEDLDAWIEWQRRESKPWKLMIHLLARHSNPGTMAAAEKSHEPKPPWEKTPEEIAHDREGRERKLAERFARNERLRGRGQSNG